MEWADEETGESCSAECSGLGGAAASPCQGKGRGFASRRALHLKVLPGDPVDVVTEFR